jgi:hypothetical protein
MRASAHQHRTARVSQQRVALPKLYEVENDEPPSSGEEGYEEETKLGPLTSERIAQMMREAEFGEEHRQNGAAVAAVAAPIDLDLEEMTPTTTPRELSKLVRDVQAAPTFPLTQPSPSPSTPPSPSDMALVVAQPVPSNQPPPLTMIHSSPPMYPATYPSIYPRRRSLAIELLIGCGAFLLITIPALYILFRTT